MLGTVDHFVNISVGERIKGKMTNGPLRYEPVVQTYIFVPVLLVVRLVYYKPKINSTNQFYAVRCKRAARMLAPHFAILLSIFMYRQLLFIPWYHLYAPICTEAIKRP
jgi:hypothetical protein